MENGIEFTIADSKNVADIQAHSLKEIHSFITSIIGRELEPDDFHPKSLEQFETSVHNFTMKKIGGDFLTPNYNEAENLSYLKQRIVDYLNTLFRNIVAKDNSLDKDEKADIAEINSIYSAYFSNEEGKKEALRNFAIKLSNQIVEVINKQTQ
jgi:hypothetical protein